jgi:hypothetical protein
MNFTFLKNIHFTKLVKTADRLREFNFRMLPGSSNSLFHVDVPDDRGNRIVFKMQRQEDRWRIVDQNLPTWIIDNEERLNDQIEEEAASVVRGEQ